MIFVTGIHGVGKTTYCEMLSKAFGIPYYSAGKILTYVGVQHESDKYVKDIAKNQKVLVNVLRAVKNEVNDFILDGHMSLINEYGKFEGIKIETFQQLGVTEIIYLLENASVVQKNLFNRDENMWTEEFIQKFIKYDLNYTQLVAEAINVPLHIIKNSISGSVNEEILMPIKKEYADKILAGKKKYEFRKTICSRPCNMIYLYVTSPYKKIVGKVAVKGKVSLSKEKLWEFVSEDAGISSEKYFAYFSSGKNAFAYILGNAEKSSPERTLQEYGINYNPQSFVYLNNS